MKRGIHPHRRVGISVVVLGLTLGLGLLPEPVHAQNVQAGTAQGGGRNLVPYDSGYSLAPKNPSMAVEDPNFESCGLNCSYHKANENISLTTDYMDRKLMYLDQKGPSKDEKFGVLGNTCTPEEQSDHTKENLASCTDRFKSMHTFWTYRARGSIGRNEQAIINLHCSRVDQMGRCLDTEEAPSIGNIRAPEVRDPKASISTNKFVQTPYFPTYQELQKLAKVSRPADGRQLHEIIADYEPKMNDFIDFIPVQDPRDPTSTMHVPRMDARGKPVYSAEAQLAFKIAHDDWAQMAALNAGKKTSKNAANPIAMQDTKEIYDEARKHQVDQINKFITENVNYKFTNQTNFPSPQTNNRTRQGDAAGPQINQAATGQEQVVRMRSDQLKAKGVMTTGFYDGYSPNAYVLPSTRPNPRTVAPAAAPPPVQIDGPSSSDSLKDIISGP